jgi:hypothetical protein
MGIGNHNAQHYKEGELGSLPEKVAAVAIAI